MDVLLTELHRNGDGMRLRSVNKLSERISSFVAKIFN